MSQSKSNRFEDEDVDIRVLTCVPTSLRARRGIHYVAGPNHTTTVCEDCDTQVWIGPKQTEFKQQHPDAAILCAECTIERYGIDALENNMKRLSDE